MSRVQIEGSLGLPPWSPIKAVELGEEGRPPRYVVLRPMREGHPMPEHALLRLDDTPIGSLAVEPFVPGIDLASLGVLHPGVAHEILCELRLAMDRLQSGSIPRLTPSGRVVFVPGSTPMGAPVEEFEEVARALLLGDRAQELPDSARWKDTQAFLDGAADQRCGRGALQQWLQGVPLSSPIHPDPRSGQVIEIMGKAPAKQAPAKVAVARVAVVTLLLGVGIGWVLGSGALGR